MTGSPILSVSLPKKQGFPIMPILNPPLQRPITSSSMTGPHSSSMIKVALIVFFRGSRKSGRKEDMVYNMVHLKTLPTSWFIASLKSQSLLDPAPFVL